MAISSYNPSSPNFNIKHIYSINCSEINSTSRRVYRGSHQLLTGGVWFVMVRKRTVYNMAPLWNLPFASVQGNYFSFRCQSDVLELIDPPSTGRKISGGFHPYIKYNHSVDHLPSHNKLSSWDPWFLTSSFPLFWVCCHMLLVLFRIGVQTDCGGPNGVYS